MGEELPECIKHILEVSGYNTFAAMRLIQPESIHRIEWYINANMDRFADILVGSTYEKVNPFALNPGHSAVIESLPTYLEGRHAQDSNPAPDRSIFSYVLQLMLETAANNAGRDAKGNLEELRYFAIYIYLVCGRACYETLSANLPIPSANTIRMLFSFSFQSLNHDCIHLIFSQWAI